MSVVSCFAEIGAGDQATTPQAMHSPLSPSFPRKRESSAFRFSPIKAKALDFRFRGNDELVSGHAVAACVMGTSR